MNLSARAGATTGPEVPTGGAALQENPARLSPPVARLFPPGVVGAELRVAGDPSLLFAEEARHVRHAVPKRMQEFAAGRQCARRALAEFGYADYPLPMNSDRRPRWPASMVGSITHTTGICGAAVAERRRFRAIGLDMEMVGRVTREIWSTICMPEETDWLASLHEPEQSRCAALLFSARESFYKCQYNVTRKWLEFDDVSLLLPASIAASGSFALRPRSRTTSLAFDTNQLLARFEFHGNLVVTGVGLEARWH